MISACDYETSLIATLAGPNNLSISLERSVHGRDFVKTLIDLALDIAFYNV